MPRTTFTPDELAYLESQRLGRIATIGLRQVPRVVPTGHVLDRATGHIHISGLRFADTRRFADMQRHPFAALVVDDIISLDPWDVRGIQVRGTISIQPASEASPFTGPAAGNAWATLVPTSISSWNANRDEPNWYREQTA